MAYLQGYIVSVGPTNPPFKGLFLWKNLISLKESKKNSHLHTRTVEHLCLKCRKTSVEETDIDFCLPVIFYGIRAVAIHQIDCRRGARTQHSRFNYNIIWLYVCVCACVHTARMSVVQRLILRRAKRTDKLFADWFIETTILFLFLLLLQHAQHPTFEYTPKMLCLDNDNFMSLIERARMLTANMFKMIK